MSVTCHATPIYTVCLARSALSPPQEAHSISSLTLCWNETTITYCVMRAELEQVGRQDGRCKKTQENEAAHSGVSYIRVTWDRHNTQISSEWSLIKCEINKAIAAIPYNMHAHWLLFLVLNHICNTDLTKGIFINNIFFIIVPPFRRMCWIKARFKDYIGQNVNVLLQCFDDIMTSKDGQTNGQSNYFEINYRISE